MEEPEDDHVVYRTIKIPTVVGLLREILQKYPNNGQILKELLQNAEDAGATTFEVLYDDRTKPTCNNAFQRFLEGPALCVYNNAEFTKDDWDGICTIYDSVKRSDPLKVGKFGLGFKSVFHFTDLVTVISGNTVLFMDPAQPVGEMCSEYPLKKLCNVLSEHGVLSQLGLKEHLDAGHIPGTIFWFPCRKHRSEISATIYEFRDVQDLFQSFIIEAPICLTFLKSLESICINQNATNILRVDICSSTLAEVQKKRKMFKKQLQACRGFPKELLICEYNMTVKTFSNQGSNIQKLRVLHYLPGSSYGQEKLNMPLVGIAAPIPPVSRNSDGCIFCFLPLPLESANKTSLPVQINGFFILDQSRRYIKWRTEGSIAEAEVTWNEDLVQNVVADAYFHLLKGFLQETVDGLFPKETWYTLLPSLELANERWQHLSRRVWRNLLRYPVVYSEVTKRMMLPQEVISSDELVHESPPVEAAVKYVMQELGIPLATIPRDIISTLRILEAEPCPVTPSHLRYYLKMTNQFKHGWDRLNLLEYVMSDETYSDLDGLPLLPLENGEWATFHKYNPSVYMCTADQVSALQGNEHQLLRIKLPCAISRHFKELASKGVTQVQIFSAYSHTAVLLPVSVKHVQKSFLHHQQTEIWLQKVWSLLQDVNLQVIYHLPIIPTSAVFNASDFISLSSAIIETSVECDLAETFFEALRLLKIKVIPKLPHYIKHCELHTYLNKPDSQGVAQALEKVLMKHEVNTLAYEFNLRRTDAHRLSFCNVMSEIVNVNSKVKALLQKLSLFEAVGRACVTGVSIEKVNKLFPLINNFPVSSPYVLLKSSDPIMQQFATKLGAIQISKEDLCIMALENKYSSDDAKKLGLYVLEDRHLLKSQRLCRFLEDLKFIPTSSGSFCMARQLYNPWDVDRDVLLGEDLTPDESYSEYYRFLMNLGLKNIHDMPMEELIRIVKDFQGKSLSQEDRYRKVKALLKVIDCRADCELVCQEIKDVQFLYGESSRPHQYPNNLAWATDNELYKPSIVKSFCDFKDIVGSTIPLINCENLPNIAHSFGWNKDPQVEKVVQHMKNLIKVCPSGAHSTNSIFYEHLKKLYDHLSKYVGSDEKSLFSLSELPIVYVGYDFIFPSEVYIPSGKEDLQLLPYMHALPYELCNYAGLFCFLGSFESQSPQLYLKVLKDIKNRHSTSLFNETEHDRNIVISILVKLVSFKDEIDREQLLLPVETPNDRLELVNINHCVYADQDCDRFEGNDLEVKVIHSSINRNLAESLGVENKYLKKFSHRMSFGQKESLTTRLRNILENYPCDCGIMKELLQNADDAGASDVKFIKDFRTHGKNKLFDTKWAPLQGPALCVYNNKGFTERDLIGIQNLGDSSKIQDPASTGQYGLGFNAVYHLTDAPSFITRGESVPGRETICLFDPHCKYDPQATNKSPGVQLIELNCLRERYPDSFLGYLESILEEEGTVFRLPLRTDEESKLGDVITQGKLEDLLKEFKSQMNICLLFLKNVRKISICSIDKKGELKTEYYVISHIDDNGQISKLMNSINIRKTTNNLEQYFYNFERVTYKMLIEDSNNAKDQWLLIQQIGSQSSHELPELVKQAFIDKRLRMLPHAGVAVQWEFDKDIQDKLSQVFCYLPLPEQSGLPICVNGHFALDNSRRNLWTESGDYKTAWNEWLMSEILAPVNAEAILKYKQHLFPRTSGNLLFEEYKKKVIQYYSILPNAKKTSGKWKKYVSQFYQYVKERQQLLFDVYIKERQVESEPVKGILTWHALEKVDCTFPMYFVGQDQEIKESLVNILKRLGMKLGIKSVYQLLSQAEIQINILSRNNVMEFLMSQNHDSVDRCQLRLLAHVEDSPFLSVKNVCEMLKYISKVEGFASKLNQIPLLVTCDELFRLFDEQHPVFCTKYSNVLPKFEHLFLHLELVKEMKDLEISLDSMIVVKHFTLKDFAEMLPKVLDEKYHAHNALIPLGDDKQPHGSQWITDVWMFILDAVFSFTKEKGNKDADVNKGKKYLLQALGEWAIYPISLRNKNYLVPIKNAIFILGPVAFRKFFFMLRPFKNYPVARPLFMKLNMKQSEILRELQLTATLEDPAAVLDALHYSGYNDTAEIFKYFRDCDQEIEILEYFGKSCQSSNLSREKLKELVIFRDVTGQKCNLIDKNFIVPHFMFQDVNNMNSIVPSFSGNLLEIITALGIKTNTIIFKPTESEKINHLYKYLNDDCIICSLDIFTKFILPNLHVIPESEHIKVLTFLRDDLSKTQYRKRNEWEKKQTDVVSKLEVTPFIMLNEELVTAKNFFDPVNEVFDVFISNVLPKEWRGNEWQYFLHLAGMIHEVTPEMVVEFASSLSIKSDDVKKKSEVLVNYICSNYEEIKPILSEICDIEFLVPNKCKELQAIFPHFESKSGMTSLSSAAPDAYGYLLWTTVSVLPQYAEKLFMLWKEELNVRNEIPEDKLFLHICNISSISNDAISNVDDDLISTVMASIYKHMKEGNLSDGFYDRFSQEPVKVMYLPEKRKFIGVDKVFIGVDKVIKKDLKVEIEPYLYQIPNMYRPYSSVLTDIGACKEVNCDHYVQILKLIHDQNQEKLNREEEECVSKALRILSSSSDLQNISAMLLYLPTNDKRLVKSTEMYVADTDYGGAITENLDKPLLDFHVFRNIGYNFVSNLPPHLKPKFLSEVVIEEVEDICEEVNSPKTREIYNLMNCQLFRKGISRLLKHFGSCLNEHGEPDISKVFESAKVRAQDRVNVMVIFNGGKVYSEQKQFHVESKSDGTSKIHILYVTTSITDEWLITSLRHFLKRLFCVEHIDLIVNICGILDFKNSPHMISEYLTENRIQDFDEDPITELWQTGIGSYLHEKFIPLLDNVFCKFDNGEIVAMKRYMCDHNSIDANVYVIVQVNRHLKDGGNVMFDEYEVSTGNIDNTFITIKAHQLYKSFRKKVNDGSGAAVPVASSGQDEEFESLSEEEILKTVEAQVKEIWQIVDGNERKHILHRLYLQWHHNKNLRRAEIYTKIIQYIQSLVSRLEREETIFGDGGDGFSAFHTPSDLETDIFTPSKLLYSYSKGESANLADVPEGRKWMRQAHHDYDEACRRHGGSACWVMYMCHQAAEKSLKAALYVEDCQSVSHGHHLSAIVGCLSNEDLRKLVSKVEQNVGNCNHLRYPIGSEPPCDRYTQADATAMLDSVNELIEKIDLEYFCDKEDVFK